MIPRGTRFGPFEGIPTQNYPSDKSSWRYVWRVRIYSYYFLPFFFYLIRMRYKAFITISFSPYIRPLKFRILSFACMLNPICKPNKKKTPNKFQINLTNTKTHFSLARCFSIAIKKNKGAGNNTCNIWQH